MPHLDPTETGRHGRRRAAPAQLVLQELTASEVLDLDELPGGAVDLYTLGPVRERCPHCQTGPLQLVLRQKRVRREHLFCAGCQRCFSACYPDGVCALSI
ncbi:MAG: hypothetical protein ACXU8N_20275 [Telluria sp.]